jgi:hypothetical protein
MVKESEAINVHALQGAKEDVWTEERRRKKLKKFG